MEPFAAAKRILLSPGYVRLLPHRLPKETSIMRLFSALALSSLLCMTVAGCHVTTHKNGNNDNVDIGTPFGSMQVKTNEDVNVAGLGITPYPGAQLLKKDTDSGGGDGAADVNMSFGSFHLGVKAVSYTTPDGADKVLAFYKKDLARYGVVLQCEGTHTIGDAKRTAQGLTCADGDRHKGVHTTWNGDDDATKNELRTGSKQHQHIVAMEPKDGGTKIGLVALDLPGDFSNDDHKDSKDSD
ncbi:MAG: hypothetical protein M3R43_13035 [Acidobacteriota bacterium]|nr:hypothetical protein [Acidobacteriota bacterium]